MAELNLKQITDKLNSEFASDVRKLVFWYDANAEFQEDIDSIELENAKVLHLEPDNQFYIKYFLEREDTTTNYLVYAPFAKPSIRDNHLADTIRYSKEFFADRASLLTLDLGIDERYKPVIQHYIKFFANKDRTQKFYDLEIENFNRSTIEVALMSVLCKDKTASFEEVLRSILTDDGLQDNKYLAEFEKYDLLSAFWQQADVAFGYNDPKPTLEKLVITMFVTYAAKSIHTDMPQAWKPFISYKFGNIIAFMDNLMNSYLYGTRFDEISEIIYNAINGKNYLEKMEVETLIDCNIFAGVDELLISWITRIMNNCILLPIEAESQDTALRIFSTLNDRGKPLSDADIFKAQFYKHFSKLGKKEEFIAQWKKLEELCERIFHPISGTPMDELFTRYMYFVRAKMGIVSSTTEALRKFYEKNSYALLKDTNTLTELIVLAEFWGDVSNQDTERFSNRVLKQFFVLNYAPNGMWTYFVSVYFMQNKDDEGLLDDEKFYTFLQKITGFIWTYAITNPGVNALRTPVYAEMVNIVNDKPVEFSKYKFDADTIRSMFDNFSFNNARPITKAMIAWWAYQNDKQPLLSLETTFEIEHIYARNRNEKENSLTDARNVESLGNKALLEKRINIRASDYRFTDKKKYYEGFTNSKGQIKEGTGVVELLDLTATSADFTENDIIDRYKKMIDCFINYLQKNGLLK